MSDEGIFESKEELPSEEELRTDAEPESAAEAPTDTYWDIVRKQFRKQRMAVFGLRMVVLMFLLAIVAPLLATSTPFAQKIGDGPWQSPWFKELFDQNRFQSGVDLFFNLALVFLLPTWLLWKFVPKGPRKRVLLGVGGLFFYIFFAMVGPQALVVESPVWSKVFFIHDWPGEGVRYSQPQGERDYLEYRAPILGASLARLKIADFEERIANAEERIAQAKEHIQSARRRAEEKGRPFPEEGPLFEEIEIAQHAVGVAKRNITKWNERLVHEEARQKDPALAYTAVLPPIGFHHDDNDEERITSPPEFAGWGNSHPFGTDPNGRDVFARILYGTRVSLTIGVIAVAIYCTIGTILGALAGFFGGWVDTVISRAIEIMICFPVFLFILVLVSVFDTRSIFLIMLAIGVISWTGVARLIRGQFLKERAQDYVAAARALGIPRRRIVFKHVLPNAIHPMFVAATFGVASAILLETGLSFLGLGDPAVPSWGQLLKAGRDTYKDWLIFAPGMAIFFTVTVLNLLGEGLRDALDPKLRQ